MNIRPIGPELFHVDGQTDRRTHMRKLTAAFRTFANAPKMAYTEPRQTLPNCKITNAVLTFCTMRRLMK